MKTGGKWRSECGSADRIGKYHDIVRGYGIF